MSEVRKEAVVYINKDVFISNFSDKQKEFASELFASFLWGAQMISGAIGYDGRIPKLEIIPTDQIHTIGIVKPIDDSFSPENFHFIFARNGFKQLLKEATKGKNDPNAFIDKISGMRIREHFEVAGVEEMAHFLFLTTKQSIGNPKVKIRMKEMKDWDVYYHTSDIEERALLWQVAYTKRYMQQYYELHKSLLEKVVAAREASRLKVEKI